ncbi:MAG: ATP-binding protein [Clostridia bacterium]|nr:ATP-binding protein [Clostridia bacterium]
MKLTKKGYKERLIDKLIAENLQIFGAISLEGPKWCGKTWTALNNSNSVVYLNNTADNFKDKRLAEMDVNLILDKEAPETIDEWQEVPQIWDAVRYKCDEDKEKGKYILTGSATPVTSKVHHSGAGRICKMNMYTMSLYESGDSTGDVSLKELFENKNIESKVVEKIGLERIAELVVRGGWPEVIDMPVKSAMRIAKSYIEAVLDKDIDEVDGVKRDKEKMSMLLRSLARNESTIVTNSTLISDIEEDDNQNSISRNTVTDYLNALDKLHLIENQNSFMYKIRSRDNVSKNPKRHFTDPSLGCAVLNITPEKLMNDLETFGFYFEALVERDLRIYSEYIGAKLYHYRDNRSGMEVDAIIELADGEYGAIEIKLGGNQEEDAATNLKKFYESAEIKPKFMCVICGLHDVITRRPDGVYVVPITALKP